MNLGQLLEGQEAVAAFNKGIQLMISSKDNDTAQVGFVHTYVFFTIFYWFVSCLSQSDSILKQTN